MKILLTNFHNGDGGGHTTYLLTLAQALASRHQVHIAAPPASRLHSLAARQPQVHALAQSFPNGFDESIARYRACRQLAGYLREHAFDIVHVNGSADHRLVMSALRGWKRRPAIVLTKHNSKPMTGLGHWWRARHGTDQVIAVSHHTRREIETSAYRRCRLDTVHNGVDVHRFSPRANPGPENRRMVLGSNAGTASYKGWMDLMRGLALLPAQLRDQVSVVIAGKPPAPSQRQHIARLGLEDSVHFPGLLEDVRPMIAGIDAGFVLSYEIETISFACREMMAMGKPVLVSDFAGLPENVSDGQDGWVVPARDHAAIAAAIRRILEQRERLPEMGRAARRRAVAEFSLEHFVERTESIYLRLSSARRQPADNENARCPSTS